MLVWGELSCIINEPSLFNVIREQSHLVQRRTRKSRWGPLLAHDLPGNMTTRKGTDTMLTTERYVFLSETVTQKCWMMDSGTCHGVVANTDNAAWPCPLCWVPT